MIFDAAHYQPDVWKRIKKIIASNRVGSAYLFSGPEGSGKEATALAMGAALNCQTMQQSVAPAHRVYDLHQCSMNISMWLYHYRAKRRA